MLREAELSRGLVACARTNYKEHILFFDVGTNKNVICIRVKPCLNQYYNTASLSIGRATSKNKKKPVC